MPYPQEVNIKGKYVFPPEIEERIDDIHYLKSKYRFDSDLDINKITVEKVIEAIKKV